MTMTGYRGSWQDARTTVAQPSPRNGQDGPPLGGSFPAVKHPARVLNCNWPVFGNFRQALRSPRPPGNMDPLSGGTAGPPDCTGGPAGPERTHPLRKIVTRPDVSGGTGALSEMVRISSRVRIRGGGHPAGQRSCSTHAGGRTTCRRPHGPPVRPSPRHIVRITRSDRGRDARRQLDGAVGVVGDQEPPDPARWSGHCCTGSTASPTLDCAPA